MDRDEALNHIDHYRCRLCGQISPITETICTKSSCRAQLGIYGELITAEKRHGEKSTDPPSTRNVKRNKLQRPHKKQKEMYSVQAEDFPENAFVQKKTILTWLDVIFLFVFCIVAYCADLTDKWRNEEAVLMSVGIMIVVTALAITLPQKNKHVLHGLMCILIGALSFAIAGGILMPANDTVYIFLAMTAAYWWLGIISFIGTSRKKKLEGPRIAFFQKKTLLINLDIVISALCVALLCFNSGFCYRAMFGKYYIYLESCIVSCVFELAILVSSIILARKEKYVWHGVLLCIAGICGFLTELSTSQLFPSLLIVLLIAVLHIWMGIMSLCGTLKRK